MNCVRACACICIHSDIVYNCTVVQSAKLNAVGLLVLLFIIQHTHKRAKYALKYGFSKCLLKWNISFDCEQVIRDSFVCALWCTCVHVYITHFIPFCLSHFIFRDFCAIFVIIITSGVCVRIWYSFLCHCQMDMDVIYYYVPHLQSVTILYIENLPIELITPYLLDKWFVKTRWKTKKK